MKINLDCGKIIEFEKSIEIKKIINDNYYEKKQNIILIRINKKYLELSGKIEEEGNFEIVEIGEYAGFKTYERTMHFILYVACMQIYENSVVSISHAIGSDIYGEIHKVNGDPINKEDIYKIKEKMKELVKEKVLINKIHIEKIEAIKIFEKENMQDKVRLLKHLDQKTVSLYELKGYYNYFYGQMASSTEIVKEFDIVLADKGFRLRYCKKNNFGSLAEFKELKKLNSIFKETKDWIEILGSRDVGELDEIVEKGNIIDIIRVSEGLHEKKIANISDKIKEKLGCKLVFIAGPSSSGKTTFAKRLSIQLRVNGFMPFPISLDDYFINRDQVPIDEDGKRDYEGIENVDIKQFSSDINEMLKGKRIEIPEYNFVTGKREYNGNYIKIPSNGVLVVEGIHALNPALIESVGEKSKNVFKIYISALTQLNLDNCNRISTTDVRMIRRIVRDNLSRGISALNTLEMMEYIKNGEEKNIFEFQEEADIMFNSTLVYELCVLKDIALDELNKIDRESNVYYDASRLKKFLRFFKSIDKELVPENSLLREFIGGSCFYKY